MRVSMNMIAAIVMACTMSVPVTVLAQDNESVARDLFNSANRERRAQGLSPLKWDNALASAAQRHAAVMAKQGTLSHQFPGESSLPGRAAQCGVRFIWLAENVAEGPTAALIHTEWVKSPHHRANLLDRDMDSIGIAVAARDGQLFAVEDFSKAKH